MSYDAYRAWKHHPYAAPDLSIVVPTFDEEIRILPTLGAIAVVVSGLGLTWELIVSDDGSRDGTRDLVRSLDWTNLRLIEHENTGKGGAVRRGVLAARGRWVLFADADNSTPIEELPRLLEAVRGGADLAIGSRAASGATESNKSALRRFVSRTLRAIVGVTTGLRVADTQCGFKLFERTAALTLFDQMRNEGFSFDLEILYLAQKSGMRVDEVAVSWFDAPGSKVDALRDGYRFFRDIVRVRWADLRGAYRQTGASHGAPSATSGPGQPMRSATTAGAERS